MKKSLVIASILGAATGVAHAESSVTLYGIIGTSINFNTNSGGHQLYNLTAGPLQGSRFGFRGSEDLGGGYAATFTLENGYDPTSGKLGQGGLIFGRQAFVGLSSNYGTVTLGRQYDALVDNVGLLATGDQWGGYLQAHAGDVDNFNNTYRTNNTVKYAFKSNGLLIAGTYSFGNVAGNFSQNQIWSLGASYTSGNLSLGVGYLNARNPNISLFGNSTSGTPSAATSNVANSNTRIYSGYSSANTYQVIGAGAAYTIGLATLGATYSNVKFMALGSSSGPNPSNYHGTAAFNNVEVNFKYQLTPALVLGTAYTYTDGSSVNGNAGAKYHQVGVGADYNLSKRTDVYIVGVYQKASGTDSTNHPAVAQITGLAASTTNHQAIASVGIRHKF
ncbi:porin [Paraburkholderia caledonica]|uniref:Porin n=1 Tax=Paraburkholderia caledonica TaxID=134536 RepID=A0AB73IMK1_9BURK|nr:putative porin [Paraburkholderia caledonica]